MWLLLKENVLDKFNIESQSTYLIKLDKTNFLVGKNNSGKSYYLRFLLRNALKIYKDDNEVIEEIKKVILNDNEIGFEYLSEFESIKENEVYKKY